MPTFWDGVAAIAAPHISQNFASGGFNCPQATLGHTTSCDEELLGVMTAPPLGEVEDALHPQCGQNASPSGIDFPQSGLGQALRTIHLDFS
jgi:hypothetical protein